MHASASVDGILGPLRLGWFGQWPVAGFWVYGSYILWDLHRIANHLASFSRDSYLHVWACSGSRYMGTWWWEMRKPFSGKQAPLRKNISPIHDLLIWNRTVPARSDQRRLLIGEVLKHLTNLGICSSQCFISPFISPFESMMFLISPENWCQNFAGEDSEFFGSPLGIGHWPIPERNVGMFSPTAKLCYGVFSPD